VTAQRFVTIHGHFYQPPRENPWLEAVETQDSAYPYHDWNERITTECYEPNASARILDENDRIKRIFNNYASISFNFGPTLLSWIESAAPETYAAILEADRVSRQRFSGHGGALAQAYNHVILPLANERDQRTQVRWGLCDFERRFGRKPEGMWLPETAVDVASLEALAAEGIAFTILEPHQAARWRRIGSVEWYSGHIDPTVPYLCHLPTGARIAIFFYDGPISRAVAFEQLLARGENFAHRLAGAFSGGRTQLVNIATDGETYGHHHRFGEMALAYALHLIDTQKLAKITNYGEHLAHHPPQHEVEIVENTSWSCAHGVERWRGDCGCSGGGGAGWNQQWRGPLRSALDWLRDEAAAIFERHGARVLRDPWAARDAYIEVILDRSDATVERFLDEHRMQHAALSTQHTLELLELQRNAMLMYTSCGWFFSDISGIETVQVLHYAGRVIQLAEKISGAELERQFCDRLAPARSNVPDRGTARDIYEREVIPARLDLTRVAAHYAVLSLFDHFDDEARVYCYDVLRHDFEIHKAGRARLAIGAIEVRSAITRESARFELAVLHLGETELTGGVRFTREGSDYEAIRRELAESMEPGGIPTLIRLLDHHFGRIPISIRSLFRDEQRRILNELLDATLAEAESAFRQLHERYDPLMRYHSRLGIPVPKVLQTAAAFDLNLQIRRMLEREDPPLAEIEARLREAVDEAVTLDETALLAFKQALERAAERFHERAEDLDRLEVLETLVTIVREAKLNVDLRRVQNRYYKMRTSLDGAPPPSAAPEWLQLFDSLGEKLAIAAEMVPHG
jgi:alpha-amylase/alpha-mannosidase (GH57 family)